MWETTSTTRFIEFIKAIQHKYFKNTVDSVFVEPSTRISQVLESGKIILTPSTGVRHLEILLSKFEEAGVLRTVMSDLQASELESIKTTFKECILPANNDAKSNRYVSELMNKGPGITSNIPPGTTLQMWLDSMIDKASEIESSLREGEKYSSHTQPTPAGSTSNSSDRVKFTEGNIQIMGNEEEYEQFGPPMDGHYPGNRNQDSFYQSMEVPPEPPKFRPYQPRNRYSPHPQQQPPSTFQYPPTQVFRGGGSGGDSFHSNPLNQQTFLQPNQVYGTSRGSLNNPPSHSRGPNPNPNHNYGQASRANSGVPPPTMDLRVPSPQEFPIQTPHSHYQPPPIDSNKSFSDPNRNRDASGRGRGGRDNQRGGGGGGGRGMPPGPNGTITCEACGRKESRHWPQNCRALRAVHPWANPNWQTVLWINSPESQGAIRAGYAFAEAPSKSTTIRNIYESLYEPEYIESHLNQLGHGCLTNVSIPLNNLPDTLQTAQKVIWPSRPWRILAPT